MIAPADSKVAQLLDAARPVTKTQVRSFLGLAGFYRRYIPNFSTIACPLTDLTRKDQPTVVRWTDACQKAFHTLKRSLASGVVTKLPDLSRPFTLRTDASDRGVGAVLLQDHDDIKYPVAFASRKLSKAEQAYSVTEKECLALVWALSKFEQYLYGRDFLLECDHQPLAFLSQTAHANSRLMRWSLFLQQYHARIKYIPGKDNVGADYMSRSLPCDEELANNKL